MLDRTKAHLSEVVNHLAQQDDGVDAVGKPVKKLAQLTPEGDFIVARCGRCSVAKGGGVGARGSTLGWIWKVGVRDRVKARVGVRVCACEG